MSWAVGFDSKWNRWIGYGVPAYCDYPGCRKEIDRGLGYVCCESQPYGGDEGCGLYFCEKHSSWYNGMCKRCEKGKPPYKRIAPEHPRWIRHLLKHYSWKRWREENPDEVKKLKSMLK